MRSQLVVLAALASAVLASPVASRSFNGQGVASDVSKIFHLLPTATSGEFTPATRGATSSLPTSIASASSTATSVSSASKSSSTSHGTHSSSSVVTSSSFTTSSSASVSSSSSSSSSSSTTSSTSSAAQPSTTVQGKKGLVNWGTAGPEPVIDWLAQQCINNTCTDTYTYTGGYWPAPVTGQNQGHMEIQVLQSSYDGIDVLNNFFIPAIKQYFLANTQNTTMYVDPDSVVAGPHPMPHQDQKLVVVNAPSYLSIFRYGSDSATSDNFVMKVTYVNDNNLLADVCNEAYSIASGFLPWLSFFGPAVGEACSEA